MSQGSDLILMKEMYNELFEYRCWLKSITNSENEDRWAALCALDPLDAVLKKARERINVPTPD